ncbi:MAG: hypothetical protein ACJ8C4_07730 [Gemmataceae bacterium]
MPYKFMPQTRDGGSESLNAKRISRGIAISLVALSVGCSTYPRNSGHDLCEIRDRTEVQAKFGTADAVTQIDGHCHEEYLTRQKIADPHGREPIGLWYLKAVTLGVLDIPDLAKDSYVVARRTWCGQTIEFVYNADGKVTAITFDGQIITPNCPYPKAP